jgi:hypothetical protein
MSKMPSKDKKYFVWLVIGVAVSWIGAWLLPITPLMKDLASIPGTFALIGALFQIFRDQAAHERQLLRDEAEHTRQLLRDEAANMRQIEREESAYQRDLIRQQTLEAFNIGAASHMADVVFDKHSQFCEEYLEEMYRVLETLFREGPDKAALEHCQRLYAVRRKYAAWVTSNLAAALDPYEKALRRIGAGAQYIEATRLTGDERRIKKIDEVDKLFAEVMGEWIDPEVDRDPERNTDFVMTKLRRILGIEELTEMRVRLVSRALQTSDQKRLS